LCQLQVAAIYLKSGVDKIMSSAWRSGEVFHFMAQIDESLNPFFIPLLNNSIVNGFLAWATILFELAFPVLVWFRRTRNTALLAGIVFHLLIGWMHDLTDFALVMIVSYLIFLKDADYERLWRKYKTLRTGGAL